MTDPQYDGAMMRSLVMMVCSLTVNACSPTFRIEFVQPDDQPRLEAKLNETIATVNALERCGATQVPGFAACLSKEEVPHAPD